jgi:hypothetical protein
LALDDAQDASDEIDAVRAGDLGDQLASSMSMLRGHAVILGK